MDRKNTMTAVWVTLIMSALALGLYGCCCGKEESATSQSSKVMYSAQTQAVSVQTSKAKKCQDAHCKDYLRVVPDDHVHWHKCMDAHCKDFTRFVPPSHKHWYKCEAPSCADYLRFVPPGHKHSG